MPGLAPDAIDAKAIGFGVMHMLWHAHDDIELQRRGGAREAYSPWSAQDAFQLGDPRRQQLTVLANGAPTQARCALERGRTSRVGGRRWRPATVGAAHDPRGRAKATLSTCCTTCARPSSRWPTFEAGAGGEEGDGGSIRAPIVGRIAKVFVKPGDSVAKGDRIAVVEAMKMEHVLHAARAGRIAKLAVTEGQQVTQGALIAALAD